MITQPPPGQYCSYDLAPELREGGRPRWVHENTPNDSDREELIITHLGATAWGRLHHFRNYYSHGWGEGRGKPLSPRALEAFYRFVDVARFPVDRRPSLFLTDDGTLELCWEDAGGKSIQIEFMQNGVEYFREADGEERILSSTISRNWRRISYR